MARKTTIDVLQRLIKKHGDIQLSEALDKLRNPQVGRPPRWGTDASLDIWCGVEAIKATWRNVTAARREYARFAKLSKTIVERRHAEGERWWGAYIDQTTGGGRQTYVASHLAMAHDLQRFIANLPTAKKPPAD